MNNTQAPIGVFDSGCGGLTVLKVFHNTFPYENFVYFADTAHLPYGTKSPTEIQRYTYAALQWLQNVAQVKLIIVACHTSSAVALDAIQHDFSIPIIGTIYPLIQEIVGKDTYKKIGIIATLTSVQSRMHEKMLYAHGFDGFIQSIPCPSFVPLIEMPTIDVHTITTAAQEYLHPFYTQSLDTLVYGCTHYPLIAPIIQSLLPKTIQYVDPAYAITQMVKTHLHTNAKKIEHLNQIPTVTQYFCSSNPHDFSAKITRIMNTKAQAHLIHVI